MDKTVNHKITIPPYWPMIALFMCLAIPAVVLAYTGWLERGEVSSHVISITFFLIVGISMFGFHMTLSDYGILIRFLGIPIRKILWEQINSATYIYNWYPTKLAKEPMTGQGILILLSNQFDFCPDMDCLTSFLLRHPRQAFFVLMTPLGQKRYVEAFQRFYPQLTFQVGYQNNLEKGKW